ncbi:MAG: transposase [Candidatus Acidiferrales bacterium]
MKSRIVRRVRQAGVYFVTTDTWERRQIFLKPGPAQIVLAQLLECRERGFYMLHALVVMPEHLHVLLTPGEEASIEKAVQMIKGGSAFKIRKELNYTSPIWHSGYHDRWIRDAHEYRMRKQYIELNPVKARLAEKPADYPLGSASGKFRLDPSNFDDEGASGAKESV